MGTRAAKSASGPSSRINPFTSPPADLPLSDDATGRGVLRRLDAEFPVIRSDACRQRCSRAGSGSAIEWQKKFRLKHREALERCFELGRIQQCARHRAESAALDTAIASASSCTPAIGAG
jgi:hypothetical protein